MPDLIFTLRKDKATGLFHATFRQHGSKAKQTLNMKTSDRDVAHDRATKLGEHFALLETLCKPDPQKGDN